VKSVGDVLKRTERIRKTRASRQMATRVAPRRVAWCCRPVKIDRVRYIEKEANELDAREAGTTTSARSSSHSMRRLRPVGANYSGESPRWNCAPRDATAALPNGGKAGSSRPRRLTFEPLRRPLSWCPHAHEVFRHAYLTLVSRRRHPVVKLRADEPDKLAVQLAAAQIPRSR